MMTLTNLMFFDQRLFCKVIEGTTKYIKKQRQTIFNIFKCVNNG